LIGIVLIIAAVSYTAVEVSTAVENFIVVESPYASGEVLRIRLERDELGRFEGGFVNIKLL
jgi:hypothetical protein